MTGVSGAVVRGTHISLYSKVRRRIAEVRQGNVRQALLSLLCAALAFLGSSAAIAQEMPKVITPPDVASDPNGLNLLTGKVKAQRPELSIPAAPRLSMSRASELMMYVKGQRQLGTLTGSRKGKYAVHVGADRSENFECEDGNCEARGSSSIFAPLTTGPSTYTQEKSRAVYKFNVEAENYDDTVNQIRYTEYWVSTVSYPDGEVLSFTYELYDPNQPLSSRRISKVQSSTGYYVDFKYWESLGANGWILVKTAAIYANSAPTTPLAKLEYSSNGTQVTDLAGRAWTCATDCGHYPFQSPWVTTDSVSLPGESGNALTYSSNPTNAFLAQTINRDSVLWTYTYGGVTKQEVNGTLRSYKYDTISVSGPNSYARTYEVQTHDWGSSSSSRYEIRNVKSSTDELNRKTIFTHGTLKPFRLLSITAPEGNSSHFEYDGAGNITKRTDKAKPGSSLPDVIQEASYSNWRPVWYLDANLNRTDFLFNSQTGQLEQQLDPADATGVRKRTVIEYEAHETQFDLYGPLGSLQGKQTLFRKIKERVCGVAATDTATCVTSEPYTTYSYFGDTYLPTTVTHVADGLSRVTTTSYDAAGRVISVDGPLTGVSDAKYVRYDAAGRKIWEVGELAPNNLRLAKKYTYRDSDDRVTKVESGTVGCTTNCATAALSLTSGNTLQVTDTTYDSRRNPIRERTYKGTTTLSATDRSFLDRGLNDCTTVRMNLGSLPTASATAACALGSQGSDGPDRITKNVYDNAGQLLKVQTGYGTTAVRDQVTYTYSDNGKKRFITDANGNKAEFRYDGHDRQSHWFFPHKTTAGLISTTDYEQYGYDAAGNRTSLRKRDGSSLAYAYDNLNRVTLKTVPSRADLTAAQTRNVYFGYDAMGRQLHARFDSGASTSDGLTNAYNGFGELTSSTLKMGSFTKTLYSSYDDAGRRKELKHPENNNTYTFSYCYDALSRLTTIGQGTSCTTNPLAAFTYANNGLVSSRTEGTGNSSVTYGWDDAGRLTSQSDIFRLNSNNVGWTFGYTPASQTKQQSRDNDSYAFDVISTVGPGSRSYAVNGLNQYTAAASATLDYDANGNLKSDGSTNYTYDIENRLVKAVKGSTTTNLTYDPLGRLFQVDTSGTTTKFLYDGDAMVAEFNNSNAVINRYVHGSNSAADDPLVWYSGSNLGNKRWLHADRLGSIVAVTDSSGGNPSINKYDEYGIPPTDASQNNLNTGRFQYTGQAWIGELGMYHYKARIYSPTLGRFLQTDPIGYEDGMNIYAYTGNDPVNGVDPTGTRCAALNAGSVYCLRRDIYQGFDRQIAGKTRFFAAAAATVEYLANNDLPLLGNFISDKAELFLRNVSAQLYSLNAKVYSGLRDGRISGPNLDRRLVHMEQSQVQAALDSLSGGERAAIVGSINAAFASRVRGLSDFASQSDRRYNNVLSGVSKALKRDIDFGNQGDREAIGNALIQDFRRSGLCSETGSRISTC